MSFTFISVPKVETACTGLLGGIEKTLRGQKYRVEFYASGARIFKNGEQVRSWKEVPVAIEKYASTAGHMIRMSAGIGQ